jgi:importin-7
MCPTNLIVLPVFLRYGNPRYAASENEKFAEYFKNTIAGPLLGPVMNCLALKAQGKYITDDVHRLALTYLASSVEMSVTYKVIKPHLDFLVLQVIFPTLCLTSEEARLFSDDPVEFIRKVHDPMEDFLDPRLAATNLLQVLARYRQKDTLPRILPYLQGVLTEYNNTQPIEARDFQRKDGVLVSMAVLFKILADSKAYRPMLEPLIVTHVLPEFQSPVGKKNLSMLFFFVH